MNLSSLRSGNFDEKKTKNEWIFSRKIFEKNEKMYFRQKSEGVILQDGNIQIKNQDHIFFFIPLFVKKPQKFQRHF